MKANELMIGDWISVMEIPAQVFELSYDKEEKEMTIGILDPQGEVYSCYYGYDHVEPIPLTAEILEKNGFRKDLMYFYLNIDDEKLLEFYTHEKRLRLWFDGVDEWVEATIKDLLFQCQCKYVHQLQHALRLCEIEKEIEL